MSQSYPAAHLAEQLGITVLAHDLPKVVAAIHRAYSTGHLDGATQAREAIMDEWSARLQSDLEHGVRSLNEKAAERWKVDYPQMSGFAAAIGGRSTP